MHADLCCFYHLQSFSLSVSCFYLIRGEYLTLVVVQIGVYDSILNTFQDIRRETFTWFHSPDISTVSSMSFFTWCLYFSLVDKSMAVKLESLWRGWCNSRTIEFLYAVLAVLAWCYKAPFNDLLSLLYFRHRTPINCTIIHITTIFSITWIRK